jgi:5-methyltetrahydropteroyltriglutamate--homocysteine methyltransferase
MLDHFRFKKHCDTAHVTAKMTIPSPAVLHFRGGRKAISKDIYLISSVLRGPRQDLPQGGTCSNTAPAAAICSSTTPQRAYLCSQDELAVAARERGDNPDGLQEIYARVINYALAERPADMAVTTHVCRCGNLPT